MKKLNKLAMALLVMTAFTVTGGTTLYAQTGNAHTTAHKGGKKGHKGGKKGKKSSGGSTTPPPK